MTKNSFIKILGVLLVVGLLFAATQTVQAQGPTTRTVCAEGCDFTTIQAAIDGAAAGDTINVAAGSYNENVTVNKQLTIVGAGAESVTVNALVSTLPCFHITADGVSLSGFKVTGALDGQTDAILLDDADNCTISNNIATNNYWGITLYNAANNTISGNTANSNTAQGIGLGGADTTGNQIVGNTASNNASNGILLSPGVGGNNTISGNTVSANGKNGISITSSNNTVTNNIITGNSTNSTQGAGVALFNGGNTIQFNTITGNTGYGGIGSVSTTANDISKNWWGSATGPTNTNNPGGTGDVLWTNKSISLLTYSPWLGMAPQEAYNGTVAGVLTTSEAGAVTGTLTGTYTLNITGQVSEYTANSATFSGIVTGDIVGDITASINSNGVDTLSGTITNTGAVLPVRILGVFPQSGIAGDFRGEIITGEVPPLATSMSMFSAGDISTIYSGQTLQLGVLIDPTTAEYGEWSTWENPDDALPDTGSTVDQNGLLTAGGTPGMVTVIAKALDGSLLDAQKTITILEPPTKLNMDPATIATTDTCASSYTVEVMVTDVTNLTGYHMEVLFDYTEIQIISVENGGWLNATGALLEPTDLGNTTGRLKFGLTQLGDGTGNPYPKTGSGSVIKITFKPLVAGVSDFVIDGANSMLVDWPDAQPIPFEVTGGSTFNFGSVVTNTTKSPTVSYCDLAVAVAQATSGDTLRADVDFGTTARVNLNKTIIFNTNGHTITRNNAASEYDSLFYVNASGNLTVNGGGTLNSKSETATNLGAAIQIAGPVFKTAKVTLEAGTTLSGDYVSIDVYRGTFTMTGGTVTDGIVMNTGGTANITGGLVQGNGAAISSNSAYSSTIITIGGTAVIDGGTGWAIYHPQRGNLNITGGTITGGIGVEMRSGNLTISGSPTITATAGDAILINGDVSNDYQGLLSATISGGEFTSTGGYALHETAPATTRTSNIAVSGGKFTGSLGAVQFTTVDPLILKLTAGAYNTDPGAMPDYVFEPLDTYLNTDNYYYIQQIIAGTITAYTTPTLEATVTGDKVDFLGEVPWYNEDLAIGRSQGNRVGLYIHEPTGFDLSNATLTIGTQTWNWQAAKDNPTDTFVPVWKLITTVPQTFTMTVKWNEVSTQVFTVNVLEDSTLQLPPAPIITSDDIQGYYLAGEAREFNVKLEMPADGANYALMIFDYKLAGVTTADITKFEFFAQDLGAWIDMGSRDQETYGNCTDSTGICGQFGWAPGGFGPIAAGFTNTTQFRVTFAKGFVAPLSFTLDLSGKLAVTDTAWTKLTTYTGSLNVYDKPTVTVATTDQYLIVGEPGAFTVTINNPTTGRNYDNSVVFDILIPSHAVSDFSALSCSITSPAPFTWDLLSSLVPDDAGGVKARIAGLDGYFEVPPTDANMVINCSVTVTTAGAYSASGNMVDVVDKVTPVERIVSDSVSLSTVAYLKPVITANNLGGPFDAGVPETVSLSIENASIPEPFEVVFNYPAGTVIVYNGVTYTCAATCPVIPVDLTAEPTVLEFTVTFDKAWTGDVSVGLYDSNWTPADRLLASASATNVVVSGGFAVTGTFSMQGNASRAGIPVTLTWGGTLVTYGPSAETSSAISNNFSVSVLYGGEYTITTLQPRYLNVTADLLKKITVAGPYNMSALLLRGGNAYWRVSDTVLDNIINSGDSSIVGTQYGSSGADAGFGNHGDCNFDGIVNIQDLALVGGNWSLTSLAAYSGTLPWVP